MPSRCSRRGPTAGRPSGLDATLPELSRKPFSRRLAVPAVALLAVAALTPSVFAQDGPPPPVDAASFTDHQQLYLLANNAFMLFCALLVFIMHLGFACVETGLTRAKNTANILMKNTMIVAIGFMLYKVVGFSMMYPGNGYIIDGWIGWSGLGVDSPPNGHTFAYASGAYTYWTDFLFQAMFAATALTIVSGAVAERVEIFRFFIFCVLYVGLIYPTIGYWKWGGGWLQRLDVPFYDFAGSTIVHACGGWAALAGVLVIGPRRGKYDGKVMKPIQGHSMPLAAIGVFLLWFGWYGFNCGSVLSADPGKISFVAMNTTLGATAGILGAFGASMVVQVKPDLSMALNGALAGLVSITAGADILGVHIAPLVGVIGGVVAVFSVVAFDRIRVDDPVGAISVHLVCGIWGTLAVGIFGNGSDPGLANTTTVSLVSQLIGTVAVGALCFTSALVIFLILKPFGLRATREQELVGLDLSEHGSEAYNGFQIIDE